MRLTVVENKVSSKLSLEGGWLEIKQSLGRICIYKARGRGQAESMERVSVPSPNLRPCSEE